MDHVDGFSTFENGSPMRLDVDALIGSHMCIQANSGGGKSGAIRRLLEVTHGHLQHIVLDVEDEFYTLRERFEYMLAGGDNGDCAASVNNAAKLARMILETGFSAIVQINSLSVDDRREFIGAFLEALIAAPKNLWRPALIVLDEAQIYAPQVGKVASSDGVISLMTLGRKRGFTGVLATPRAASIHKDATGPCNNWLIGRVGQPADRRAAADALGFSANSEEARGLRSMERRHFWAFGPALCIEPTRVVVQAIETTAVRAGQAPIPTPPAPAAMRKILAELTAAAAAADEAGPDAAGAPAAARGGAPDPRAIEAAERRGYDRGHTDGHDAAIKVVREHLTLGFDALEGFFALLYGAPLPFGLPTIGIEQGGDRAAAAHHKSAGVLLPGDAGPPVDFVKAPPIAAAGGLSGAARATLQALAWWAAVGIAAPTRKQLAAMLNLDPAGSTMRARLAELSKSALIEYPQPGTVRMTVAGFKAAPAPDRAATLVGTIRASLSAAALQTFNALPKRPGDAVSKDALAQRLGLEAGGSTLRARLADLSGRELIAYPKPGLVTRQDWVIGE